MSGRSSDGDLEANRAGDRIDDADRQFFLQQNRALLDVHFEITRELVSAPRQRWNLVRLEAGLPHHLVQAAAIGVAPLQHPRIEPSGDRAAAEKARGKPHALFFRESDDVEMKRQFPAQLLQLLHQRQRDENPEPPVISAGVADGIVMRGNDDGARLAFLRRVAADHVTDGIDLRDEPGLPHPAA